MDDSSSVYSKINNYLSDYPSNVWPNLKCWYAHDEPHSIDAFIPIKKVDEIVRNAGSAPLITHFFEVNVYKNGIPSNSAAPVYQRVHNHQQQGSD